MCILDDDAPSDESTTLADKTHPYKNRGFQATTSYVQTHNYKHTHHPSIANVFGPPCNPHTTTKFWLQGTYWRDRSTPTLLEQCFLHPQEIFTHWLQDPPFFI